MIRITESPPLVTQGGGLETLISGGRYRLLALGSALCVDTMC